MKIFLCYRRSDQWIVDRIASGLREAFGDANVFRDLENLYPGLDFEKQLDAALAECDVLLAIITPGWATNTDDKGVRRLHRPDDPVRREIEKGLGRDDVRVVPVLIGQADQLREEDLPESLKQLVKRQSFKIDPDPHFDYDLKRLIRSLSNGRITSVVPRRVIVATVVCSLIAFAGIVVWRSLDPEKPFDLESAVDRAANGSTVVVPAGTFVTNITIDKSITLRGAGSQSTKLRRKAEGPVIRIASAGAIEVRIEDLSIVGDYLELSYSDFNRSQAHGIYAAGSSLLTLRQVEIQDQSRSGLRADGTSTVRVYDSKIWENFDGILADGSPTIEVFASQVTGNHAAGVHTDGNASLKLSQQTTLSGNGTRGLFAGGSGAPRAEISDCIFTNNGGPGIEMLGGFTSLRKTTISKNAGGGVFLSYNSRMSLKECDIIENEHDGIALVGQSTAEISGNTIARNQSYGLSRDGRNVTEAFQGTIVPPIAELERANVFKENGKGNILLR